MGFAPIQGLGVRSLVGPDLLVFLFTLRETGLDHEGHLRLGGPSGTPARIHPRIHAHGATGYVLLGIFIGTVSERFQAIGTD